LSNHDAQDIAELIQPGTPVDIVGEVKSYREQVGQSRHLAFQYHHVADSLPGTPAATEKPTD
jgi:hypothetical protein